MNPLDPRDAQPGQPPQPQPTSQPSGFMASLGGFILGYATSHEKTDATKRKINWEITPVGQLINDFSRQATQKIVEQAKNTFVAGGAGHIEQALKDMLGEVFLTFATKGVAHPENLTHDQLADHFIASIITIIATEFKTKPEVATKQHFINIADKLLKEAFPKELEDPHLPKALREILTGKGMYAWAASYFIDTKQFNWNQLVALFAEHLEAIYKSLSNPQTLVVDEGKFPGVVNFVLKLVNQADSSSKEVTQTKLDIPLLNKDSNVFLNQFLTRLLRNDIKYQEDIPVLNEARSWLVTEIKTGLQAVVITLLEPQEGQTPQERRFQIAERLLAKANSSLPEIVNVQKVIQTLDEAQLKDLLKKAEGEKEKGFFHERIKAALTKIDAAKPEEKGQLLDMTRKLLLEINSYLFIESLLAKELDLTKLQKLLPPSLPLKVALEQLYDFLSPFVQELVNQWKSVSEKGGTSEQALKGQGGAEISGWIEKILKITKKMVETKAEAGTLQPSGFQFLDEMLCHVLKPTGVQSLIEAKDFADALLKELITIIVFKAIEKNRKGNEPLAKTMATIVNNVLEAGQKAISDLGDVKKATAITKELCEAKALALGMKLKPEDLAQEKLADTFSFLFLVERSRQIISSVIGKELFNELLPTFLRDFSLWESGTELFAAYLKGMAAQAEQIQMAAASGKLELKVPEVRALVHAGVVKLLEKIKAPTQAETTFEQIKAQVLQGSALQSLVTKLVPTFCESVLAYHLNPTAAMTAEARAAQLFLSCMSVSQAGFDEIEQFEAAPNKQQWLEQHELTGKVLEEYRKLHDIAPDVPLDVREFLLRKTSKKLVDTLLPKALSEQLIPKEFAIFNIQQQLANLCFDYLKQAFDYAHGMKALASGAGGEPQMMKGLDTYIQKQLQTLLAAAKSEEASWMQKVVQKIYATQDPSQKAMLHQFAGNLLFGGLGFIFANAKTEKGNLLTLLAPIARTGQKSFHTLNEKRAPKEIITLLKITDEQIRLYLQAIGKPIPANQAIVYEALNVRQLAYFVTARSGLDQLFNEEQWKALIPEFMRPLFTKETAATFACPIIEMIHDVQELMQKYSSVGLRLAGNEEGLKEYVNKKVSSSISEFLMEMGASEEPLSKALPPILDNLLKQIFVDESTSFGDMRNLLVSRAVYTVVERLLADPKTIIPKLEGLVESFEKGNAPATATLLINTAFPKELYELPLAKIIVDEIAAPEITEDLMQVQKSIKRIQEQGKEAKAFLEKLDGVPALLQDMLTSLDSTLDEMAESQTEQISDDLPKFVDDQLKLVLKSPKLAPLAKEALHSILFICLKQAIAPKKPGQTVQERALEVMGEFITLFNKESTEEVGIAWLNTLLPANTLQNLLPEFLRKAITHKNLVRWFFKPYVKQVQDTAEKVRLEAAATPKESLQVLQPKMQKYAKDWFISFTKPTATKRGLTGYEGVVHDIEKKVLEKLEEKDPLIGKNLDTYVDATVAQIMQTLETGGRLRADYLADGLISALPKLKADAPRSPDMPATPEAFNKQAAQKLLNMLFPNGKEGLAVPDLAKRAVWNKLEKAVEALFADLTTKDRRLLFTLDRLVPFTTDDKKVIGRRRQEIEDMRLTLQSEQPDRDFMKKAEQMVKDYTIEAAVHEAEKKMDESSLWGPFKWIAKQAVKLTTYVAMRFSVSDRIFSFLKDDKSDGQIRNFLWNFLSFPPAAVPKQKERLKQELAEKIDIACSDTELLPWILRWPLSSAMADYYHDKNFVQLLS